MGVLATLSLDTTLTKHLVQTPEKGGSLLGSALGLRLMGCLVLLLVLLPVSLAFDLTSKEQTIFISLAYGALAVQSSIVYGFLFSATANIRPLVTAQFIQVSIFSILRIFLITENQSIYLFQASFIGEALFSLLATRYLFKRRFSDVHLSWSSQLARQLLRESLPLLLSMFFITAFMKIDILIVSLILPMDQVGIYTAAVRIVETYMMAITVLFGQGLVWLTEVHRKDVEEYRKGLLKLFRWGFLVTSLCCVFNGLAGHMLFRWLLGDAYAESIQLSVLLSISLFATTTGTIRSFAFSLEHLNIYHLWSSAIGLLVGIPLTLALTLDYGLTGTCIALILAYFASAFGTSLLFPALRPIGRLQLLLSIPRLRHTRIPQ